MTTLFVIPFFKGCALFMHKDKKSAVKESDILKESHPFALIGFGELLLLISLALDGFTGAIQDRMNSHHTTKTHSMMYNINLWSCLWLFICMF
jgi:solute carrier family 35 (UDP-galactose transporter), member B1